MATINGTSGNDPLTRTQQADSISGLAGDDSLLGYGFAIKGIEANDRSGDSVSNAGDFNKDGFDDIIIGSIGESEGYRFGDGSSYVVFGKSDNFRPSFNLSDLNGSNGFALNNVGAFGVSVNSAGDVNGDGFDDIIIESNGGEYKGVITNSTIYVVFGSSENLENRPTLSNLNGSNGFVINDSGAAVSSAGDVNGDGFDDIIVGVADSSYVVFGKAGNFNSELNFSTLKSTLNGSNGFVINDSGAAVSSAGDVNDDGFDDIITVASGADVNDQSDAGSSYVIFGKVEGFGKSLNPSKLDGSNGFVINGTNPWSVTTAGDVNGDSFDDILIRSADKNYVVFGSSGNFDTSINLSRLNGSNGFVINGTNASSVSSSAGDVNGDGFDDLIIGDSSADANGKENAGKTYVVFGKAEGFGTSLNLSDINDRNGLTIDGSDEDEQKLFIQLCRKY